MAHAYLAEHWDRLAAGDRVEVVGDEARHAVKAARLRVGERIVLLNGRGGRAEAEVVEASPSAFLVRAVEDSETEPAPAPGVTLVQALAKGGRDEMAVQAAVELGAEAILPWQAQRSITRWQGEKRDKQRARWQTIAREAAKQAIRAHLPRVEEPVDSGSLAERMATGRWLVLEPSAETVFGELELAPEEPAVGLVVGPEGGIAPAELERFREAGATPVRLGRNVLRTSTAGPAAMAALLTRLGRW